MKCFLNVKDEVWCYLSGLHPTHVDTLWNTFAVHVDGYFFMPAYKLGRWDGKVRFFEKTGKTYVRLLPEILPYLDKWGYDIELTDDRTAYESPDMPGKIIKYDSHGIATTAEGLDIMGDVVLPNGKTFELRPYQYECVKLAVEAGSGFILAGTGAGKCVSGCTLINIKASKRLRDAVECVRAKKSNTPIEKE